MEIVLILLWLACGVICYFIMKSKGYSNDACLLHGVGGFFLGFIWLIVDLCKKPNEQGTASPSNVHAASNLYNDLEKLSKLHVDGVLSNEEFTKLKENCLNSSCRVESIDQRPSVSEKSQIKGNKARAVLIVSIIAILLCGVLEIKNLSSYSTLEDMNYLDSYGGMFYSNSTMNRVHSFGEKVESSILIVHVITVLMAISGVIGIVGRKKFIAGVLSSAGLGIAAILGFCNIGNGFFWDCFWMFSVACAVMAIILATVVYSSQKSFEC